MANEGIMINEDIKSYLATGESVFRDIYPFFFGGQECPPLHSFGPTVRDYYLLHICFKGKGVFYSNEQPFPIEKGQCFLIYPHELTFYQADEEEPWSYVWVALGGERLEKYLEFAGLTKENPVCLCRDTEKAVRYIEDILAHNTAEIENEFYIQGVLMKLFAELLRASEASRERESENTNYYISGAISYINLHFHEPITVQEIADFLGLNRSYLTEVFVREVHISPHQFLVNYRMAKASEFLMYTDVSMENIAYSCGYANLSSFSKAFKKIVGCSPAVYRRAKKSKTSIVNNQRQC